MTINAMPILTFQDSPSIKGREDRYMCVRVDLSKTIQSWKNSLYSYEWLGEDGHVKTDAELDAKAKTQKEMIESALVSGGILNKPVLGIGIFDGVEIGAGKDVLLTLYAHGLKTLDVHIPKSNEKDFKKFLAK